MQTFVFLWLPSQRTLRDYTHYFKSQAGFQPDLSEELKKEADIDSLPESKQYVTLLTDEMKIKQDLFMTNNQAKSLDLHLLVMLVTWIYISW